MPLVFYADAARDVVSLANGQVITMTKSLGSLLSRAEGRLAPLLRLHVHASTQQMAQGDLVPVLHRADKKKRDIVTHLLQVLHYLYSIFFVFFFLLYMLNTEY